MNRTQADVGSTHVLEATIVASIMVSAVAFVVTFDAPEAASYDARESLSTKARDALDILYDTPVESKFGSDALSAYIAECLNAQCGNLSDRLAKLVPEGASYALYLSNGYDTYPIIINGTPGGEAVSATRTFEPDWSHTFLATATESIGTSDALLVYALPIYRSTPVAPGGSQILVKVSGTRADGSDYVLLASAATSAHATNDLEATAASLYFVHPTTNAVLPVYDMSASSGAHRMKLRLEETQNAYIPAKTEVQVHMPRGWTAVAPQADNPSWKILANATDANGRSVGSAIKAELIAPLRMGQADLVFDATYLGDELDFYPILAQLSKGATATASMLVRADVHSSDPSLATPSVHLSVPGPMGRGGTGSTTWTLAAHIPVSDEVPAEQASSVVRVHTVELIEQEGNDIFGSVTADPPELAGGSWTNGGDHLRWEGDVEMHLNSALNLTFRVTASGTPGPTDVRSQFLPPVTFDEWTGRLVGRTGWGFSRQAILPANEDYAGYDPEAGPLGVVHPLETNGVYRNEELPGKIQYNVSLVGAVEDSLYGSYVTAERRNVPLGGDVIINANVQSLLFALAEAGQSAGVTLRFYPPWSGDARIPIYEQENLDQGLLSGEVAHIVTLDINADGYPDPIVGTTNGRVIGYHGLTGQRLQGNAFTANLTTSGEQQAIPRITAMTTVRYGADDYIVVGTDSNSEGLYVLNTSFGIRWKFRFDVPADSVGIDASTDFNADGRSEIVVARAYEAAGTKKALTYVLEAPSTISKRELDPIPGVPPPSGDPKALYDSVGTPTAVLAQSSFGPAGAGQGVLVPMQSLIEPGVSHSLAPPYVSQGAPSLPRAGVQGIDETGAPTSVAFGMPATVLRDYDYDGDAVRDVVLGGSSGYVVMENGTVLTQPLYSYVSTAATTYVSADSLSSTESYALTSAGEVFYTDDSWASVYLAPGAAVGGNAIALDGPNSYWIVGASNGVWRSVFVPTPPDPTSARAPASKTIQPFTPASAGFDLSYNWATYIHDLRTVDFFGSRGYIGGTGCIVTLVCTEPILLATQDGGATWARLSHDQNELRNRNGGPLDKNITRVKINADGTAWLVGDGGLVARNLTGSNVFVELETPFTYDIVDIACLPGNLDDCYVVGDSGAAFRMENARTTPSWTNLTGTRGLPNRDFYAIGFPDNSRGYIGSTNMILGRFQDSNWTTLPLNYIENDGRVVSTVGDGTGYVYGGSPGNGRIWLLHDYHTRSQVTTKSFGSGFGSDAHIYNVLLVDGNVSLGEQSIVVEVTEGTQGWLAFAPLAAAITDDPRKPLVQSRSWLPPSTALGQDLQFRISLSTSGDKTVLSPHVRALSFDVNYLKPNGVGGYVGDTKRIELDFSSLAKVDQATRTADWNTTVKALRQPLVNESWTRNVTGEVHDIITGYDVVGTPHKDVWVATGDVLAENSPDHIIYAGTNTSKFIEDHNRVYLLNGKNGTPEATSAKLGGEVRHIRLSLNDQGAPATLWAATWDSSGSLTAKGTLYALDPRTLEERFHIDLGREVPGDLEVGKFPGPHHGAFVGGQRPTSVTNPVPHLRAIDEVERKNIWEIIPDDLGKYVVSARVKPSWLYGPYVVEIEVEWEEGVDTYASCGCPTPPVGGGEIPQAQTILRSARFYDHFMVAPPDAINNPNPLYTARLLVWMRDWG